MPAYSIRIHLDLWIRIRIPVGKNNLEFSKKSGNYNQGQRLAPFACTYLTFMPADSIRIHLDLWNRIRIPGSKNDNEFSENIFRKREITIN
jgi:hypothetical protein